MGMIWTAAELTNDATVDCDVCIVGSGAGGSVLAAGLCERGLDVVMLEEGGYHTRRDFDLQEATAYPMLYQDRGARSTTDLAWVILQGRSVGGSTTINWTTCFRTPDRIFERWRDAHGVTGLDSDVLRPHFEAVETRLKIDVWPEALANVQNRKLLEGCRALGWEAESLRRNVSGCFNSGYCGVGCPVDAKQAMHLTFIPDALDAGLRLYANTRADRLEVSGDRVVAVHASVMDPDRDRPAGPRVTVRPKITVSSCGAINGPALLLRSDLDDHRRVGKRTFLHPVQLVPGRYEERIDPWSGAPQSIASHEFIDRGPDKLGFFMEVSPIHPVLAAGALPFTGDMHRDFMRSLGHHAAFIALHVDGFIDGDEGGTVTVHPDGRAKIDYPFTEHLVEGFRASTRAMARVHLAAGARYAATMHHEPRQIRTEADLALIDDAPYAPLRVGAYTAHQMGGCAMGGDPTTSVVDSTLTHWRVRNLFVVDGSVFPTSLGVNPSESIYGLAHWASDIVAAAV